MRRYRFRHGDVGPRAEFVVISVIAELVYIRRCLTELLIMEIWVPFPNLSVCLLSGMSSTCMGCVARERLTCGSYQPDFGTGGGLSRAHSRGEATWAFLTGIEQPLAESVIRSDSCRDLQHAAPMVHPEGPSHVVGIIAERLNKPVSGNLSEWSRTT